MITKEIQEIVHKRVDQRYAPAIAIAIVDSNSMEPEYYQYGSLSYQKSNDKVSKSTRFQIGSITKTFTGVLLADLVLKGKIKLEDSVAVYFEELKNIEPITLKELVTHTSGLPNFPANFYDSETLKGDPMKNYSKEKLFKWLEELKYEDLQFSPSRKFKYSSLGFELLGCILAKVYGKSYQSVIKEIILDPLEMKNTCFSLASNFKDFSFAVPHFGEQEIPFWHFQEDMSSAGGLCSTTEDLIKYIKAHLGFTHQDTPIGKALAQSHCELFNEDNLTQCYGIRKTGGSSEYWYEHTGSTGGSTAYLIINMREKRGGVILCNAGHKKNLEILKGTLFPNKLGEILKSFQLPAEKDAQQMDFSLYSGEYVKDNCQITIVSQKEKLLAIYNTLYQKESRNYASSKEVFYLYSGSFFYSKSYGLKLEFTQDETGQKILMYDNTKFKKV